MIPSGRAVCCVFGALVAAALASCAPKPKAVTELQRKQAAHLESEAQFALTLRDWSRAEGLLAQAVVADPNNGQYWLSLGSVRMRLANKARAKEAYEGALKAFQVQAQSAAGRTDAEPWLNQVQALALLGRVDEARTSLDRVGKQFPEHRAVRAFIQDKQFDRMIADPSFQEVAIGR